VTGLFRKDLVRHAAIVLTAGFVGIGCTVAWPNLAHSADPSAGAAAQADAVDFDRPFPGEFVPRREPACAACRIRSLLFPWLRPQSPFPGGSPGH
jgi:hypothetical protein